jgi:hypothetical protein
MLIYSIGVSVDGFIADRDGAFGWTDPNEEQFRFHITQVRELGSYLLGRRLYETMLVWDTDLSLRDNELGAAFADVWCAIPKVVFSRTLDSVQGNARLARPRRRAANVPQSDCRRWRYAVSAAGHRRHPADLIETRTFGSRVIYERYGRAPQRAGLTEPE